MDIENLINLWYKDNRKDIENMIFQFAHIGYTLIYDGPKTYIDGNDGWKVKTRYGTNTVEEKEKSSHEEKAEIL